MRLRKVIDDHLVMQRKSRTDFANELGMSKARWGAGSTAHVKCECGLPRRARGLPAE